MSTIGCVISDGGLTAILDLTAGTVLYTAPAGVPFNSVTGCDRVPSGTFALGNNGTSTGSTGPLSLWRWNAGPLFTPVAPVAAPPVAITSNTLANPTVITCAAPHFLVSGQTVTIAGNVGSVPTINNAGQTVTVISPTTFSIPVHTTTGGTGGTVQAGNAGAWYALSANGANVWAADTTGSATRPVFRQISGNPGSVLASSGPITTLANSARIIAVSIDEKTMYYTSALTGAPIKRWDLINNVALTDLVSPADIILGMWTVPGTTDIVVVTQTAYSGSAPVHIKVIRYTTAAATVFSVDVYDLPASAVDMSVQIARDLSITSVWIRTPAPPLYLQSVQSTYLQVSLLTGAILQQTTIAFPGIGYFNPIYGVPPIGLTYPFVILGTTPGGSASGIPCAEFA